MEITETSRGVWIGWAALTALAFGIGSRAGTVLPAPRDAIVVGFLGLACSFVVAGALQGMILRRILPSAGSWMLLSVASVAVMAAVVFGVGMVNRDVGWVLGVVLAWVVLGALQWTALRGQVDGAGWWIVANVLGLLLAIPVVALTTWLAGAPPEGALGNVLRWVAFGGTWGVVTASALVWLLQSRLEPAVG